MRIFPSRLAAGIAALVTVAVTASPAVAVGASITDPVRDLTVYRSSASAAQRAQIDLRKVDYWRDSTRFYVRWTVRDLVADVPGTEHYSFYGKMTVGDYTGFAVVWNSGYGFKVYLTSGPSNGGHEICTAADKRRSRNTTANTITVSVPKSCLPHAKLLRSPQSISQIYSSTTVYVADTTATGPSIYPNP